MQWNKLKLVHSNAGQAQVEYVLILCAVGLPMFGLLQLLLDMLIEHYRMLTFIETLPFP